MRLQISVGVEVEGERGHQFRRIGRASRAERRNCAQALFRALGRPPPPAQVCYGPISAPWEVFVERTDSELIAEVSEVIAGYGCRVTGIGPHSVGVQGDARVYGPSVVIAFPKSMSDEEVAKISNEITNRIKGVTRVLKEI